MLFTSKRRNPNEQTHSCSEVHPSCEQGLNLLEIAEKKNPNEQHVLPLMVHLGRPPGFARNQRKLGRTSPYCPQITFCVFCYAPVTSLQVRRPSPRAFRALSSRDPSKVQARARPTKQPWRFPLAGGHSEVQPFARGEILFEKKQSKKNTQRGHMQCQPAFPKN